MLIRPKLFGGSDNGVTIGGVLRPCQVEFSLQKMNRDANMIGAKANDAQIAQRMAECQEKG